MCRSCQLPSQCPPLCTRYLRYQVLVDPLQLGTLPPVLGDDCLLVELVGKIPVLVVIHGAAGRGGGDVSEEGRPGPGAAPAGSAARTGPPGRSRCPQPGPLRAGRARHPTARAAIPMATAPRRVHPLCRRGNAPPRSHPRRVKTKGVAARPPRARARACCPPGPSAPPPPAAEEAKGHSPRDLEPLAPMAAAGTGGRGRGKAGGGPAIAAQRPPGRLPACLHRSRRRATTLPARAGGTPLT